MKNYRWLNQNNKGITLIALVLTIIILIILAGISINLILGDNGLLGKAKDAREQQTIESIREKLDIVKGSDYLEQEGNNNIDTYFETLEKEKIEPYTVTNKQKMTDVIGNVEVDNKYSYIVKIENNKNLKIEYEGKIGDVTREPDEITITIKGEKEQTTLPVTLSANIKANGENVTSGKYVINNTSNILGTEDSLYTEKITSSNINVILEKVNTHYVHTLTIDRYGRKQETIKGPITVTTKYHTHIGDSSSIGGCYETPIYHSHTSSCYTSKKCPGTWKIVAGPNEVNDYLYRCSNCGASSWSTGGQGTWACNRSVSTLTCNTSTSTIESYGLSCGKSSETIDGYKIEF